MVRSFGLSTSIYVVTILKDVVEVDKMTKREKGKDERIKDKILREITEG